MKVFLLTLINPSYHMPYETVHAQTRMYLVKFLLSRSLSRLSDTQFESALMKRFYSLGVPVDRWMDDLRCSVLSNSISVISGR